MYLLIPYYPLITPPPPLKNDTYVTNLIFIYCIKWYFVKIIICINIYFWNIDNIIVNHHELLLNKASIF